MAQIDRNTITLGNILSMVTTVLAGGGAIIAVTTFVGTIQSEMRTSDARHELRLDRLEADIKQAKSDHDLLIEIRQNVIALRNIVERRAEATPLR